jgi:hypothetical protein
VQDKEEKQFHLQNRRKSKEIIMKIGEKEECITKRINTKEYINKSYSKFRHSQNDAENGMTVYYESPQTCGKHG